MALSCISGKTNIAAQTLFLGASIADFNVNMAWGGQPARLSVKLVEDNSGCTDPPFRGGAYGDNHFNECSSDPDCFIDENGNAFDPNISQERIVPGKVYYKWDSTKGFVSQYWYNADPGFFGRKSSINYAGSYDINSYNNNAGLDIINTPVIFKMGDFSFAGLVQSWEENYDSGGLNYNISIESMDSLLEQSWIILDKHAGAVYGILGNNTYGGPTNWIGDGLQYKGSIKSGNISNVFNVYGFLESMGIGNFGGSNKNDNGISAAVIMDALSVLTSCDNTTALDAQNKRAFSPFGRILAKVAQEHISYNRVTSNLTDALGMGILPVVEDDNGQIRCPFILDLSELPRPPLDYRIQDPAMSILSFIQTVTTATGSDFYIETIPVTYSNKKYNVLKVKTITRSAQPNPRQIQNTIDAFIDSGYKVTSSRLGKEKNNNTNRVLYLGAPQQRLFQAKSYRLAFSQSQYVYNPNKKKFVEYYGAVAGTNNAGQPGKYRAPNALSTRNPAMVSNFTSKYASLFAIDEDIKNAVDSSRFDNVDSVWGDAYLSGTTRTGNYSKTTNITKSSSESGSGTRFFPLYKDIVSPFFGFKHEENFAVNTTAGQSNVFRRVRPVWMDSWSGQILVLMELAELPKTLSVPLVSPYSGSTIFTISESEIRASDNLDSFITYCQGKIFKPDLFRMLKTAYTLSKKVIFDREINAVPYVAQGNSAGATGAPVSPRPVSHTMGTDYNLFMSQDFLRDLNIIREFIHRIGSYYGKKYLVKMPEVMSYKDQQYQSSTIPGSLTTEGSTSSPIQVYQGSGKIFYSYEPASDGAWEEYGNIIDDSIVVGSTDWYSLIDDNGKIQPIVGYNATESVDYVGRALVNYLSSRVGTRITPVTTTTPTTPTTSVPAAAATPTATPTPQAAAPIVVPWDQYQLISIINNLKKKIGSSNLNNIDNFKYSTIDLSGLSEDDIVIKNSTVATKDALGEDVGNAKKIYCKTTVDQQFVFLDPVNLRFACAIINAPGPSLNSSSKFYTQDPLNSVVAVASMEDLAIYSKIYSSSLGNRKAVIRILTSRISHILGDDDYLLHIESNSSPQHHRMRSKVAHPYFAAVPVKSNVYSYGPWTNYLDLDKNLIFPDAVGSVDNAVENVVGGVKVEVKSDFAPWNYGGMSFLDSAALSEIYGEVQYQQVIETATLSMPGLPIFGIGSSFEMPSPRDAGGSSIYYNNQEYTISTRQLNYTKKTKTPSANESLPQFRLPVYSPLFDEPTINNIPLNYNTIILSSSASPVSPIISSISCNISPQSVSTSYSFRTYTQKLGFFNKENSERIKLAGLNNIKANKQLASLSQSFNNKIYIESRNNARDTTVGDYDAQKFETGFYGKSPTQILIGMASSYASPPVDMKTILNKAINDTTTDESFYIRCGADPGDQKTLNLLNANSGMLAFMNNIRWNTEVGAFMSSEATTDLGTNYSLKSAMSLDGIFSPISFYPTKFNTTYSLFKQIRKNCIECNGTGKITEDVYMVGGDSVEPVEYACPYCSFKRPQLSSSTTTRANKTESLPPYIITNDNDINTLLQFNTSSSLSISSASNTTDTSKKTGLDIPVNAVSLQPIVVPYGEFKNNNVQSDDRSRHCIQVVARGNTPPQSGALYNLNTNLKILVNPADGNIIDTQGQGVNADYYAFDIRAQFDDVGNSTNKIPMNQRFFGLRGPLMVHGWGYDLEGYPVPNASDEPQFLDTKGRPARFVHKIEPKGSVEYKKLKIGDTFSLTEYNANDINQFAYYTKTINTQVLDTNNNWKIPNDTDIVYKIIVSNDLENTPSNPLGNTNSVFNSGDIITKQYTHNGTKWVKGPRSRQFYLNWAERPDIWPVGPIDLRWDENRRVWTINAGSPPYKLVYVTLEEDLLKENDFDESYPAKGFLDDIEYSKEPLQTGYRRLVYVRDKTGYTAPRGVKLLCRYDTDSGFYEPVSKPSIIAYGTISSGNQASITMDYAQGNRAIQSPILTIKFANPLELAVRASAKGIFTYLRGQWILTSIG